MGVPALFRWLSAKYPKTVRPVVSDDGEVSAPNPNGTEFDNLYLDMNGIIHPCCHPVEGPAPPDEDAMITTMFAYIDKLVALVRPRKLLYLAIDGVAPRAKMNQQRSRRFRAAKERLEKQEKEATEPSGDDESSDSDAEGAFDSNCITPGTVFMDKIARSLRYYVAARMNADGAWRGIKVVLSDASVPGEGEHKIVDYIRRARMDPAHDPNTRHVIYGLDADLIMLALATHEPHFYVLREDVFAEDRKRIAKKRAAAAQEQRGDAQGGVKKDTQTAEFDASVLLSRPFVFLDISVLREYLLAELAPTTALPFVWEPERALDDWVFLCFFVGNDFLPHLPCLEIREGAIDVLMEAYRRLLPGLGGHLCYDGDVVLDRVQPLLHELARVEHMIFVRRREKEQRFAERDARQERASEALGAKRPHAAVEGAPRTDAGAPEKEDPSADTVRLWEGGARERYYSRKFGLDGDALAPGVAGVVHAYVEGLCWVMAYYYQGVPSWKWFYPHNYAPLAADMAAAGRASVRFERGEPFRPFDQLMGVFPSASAALVPAPLRPFMTEEDSPIADFYPRDFTVDMEGKRHAWHGVVLLPFIEECRLLDALEPVYARLDPADAARNVRGSDRLFLSLWHPAASRLLSALDDETHAASIDPGCADGFTGRVWRCGDLPAPGESLSGPPDVASLPPVEDLAVAAFRYAPPFSERAAVRHRSAPLLPGTVLAPPALDAAEVYAVQSGQAARRVTGRLLFEPRGARDGRHSMHAEHMRADYARAERGGYGGAHDRPGAYGQPARGYGQGANGYGDSDYGYGQSGNGYAQPAGAYGQPGHGYGQTSGSYGQPAGTYGQPAGTYGQPAGTYGQPAGTYGHPQGATAPPSGGYGHPQGAAGQPQASQWSSGAGAADEYPAPAADYPPPSDGAGYALGGWAAPAAYAAAPQPDRPPMPPAPLQPVLGRFHRGRPGAQDAHRR